MTNDKEILQVTGAPHIYVYLHLITNLFTQIHVSMMKVSLWSQQDLLKFPPLMKLFVRMVEHTLEVTPACVQVDWLGRTVSHEEKFCKNKIHFAISMQIIKQLIILLHITQMSTKTSKWNSNKKFKNHTRMVLFQVTILCI